MIDFRDNRGKRHNLAFVILNVVLSMLSGLYEQAAIVRNMKRSHKKICKALKYKAKGTISEAQIGRLLTEFDWKNLEKLNKEYFGFEDVGGSGWSSVDGKELCGTIDKSKGERRGLSLVRLVWHTEKTSRASEYFDGRKASEVIAVRELLGEVGIAGEKITLDALRVQFKISYI